MLFGQFYSIMSRYLYSILVNLLNLRKHYVYIYNIYIYIYIYSGVQFLSENAYQGEDEQFEQQTDVLKKMENTLSSHLSGSVGARKRFEAMMG